MQSAGSRRERTAGGSSGIVYRVICQNPGCGSTFDLRITPENAGLLGASIACPRCRRHGGFLKPEGRIGKRLFQAKLLFRATGLGPSFGDDEEPFSAFSARRY